MKRFIFLLASIAIAAALVGCGNKGSEADAPPDFTAIPGDGVVTIAFTATPGVDYWLFYAPGTSVTTANWESIGGRAVINVTSPYTLTALTNNTTYSFTMNGRKSGGPGGPGAPTKVATPRLAGSNWTVGVPLGTGRLNGVATLANVNAIVGAGGSIFSGAANAVAVARTNPAAPADLNAAASATTGFVAVGAAGTIVSSVDGTTWTTRTSGTTADLNGLASSGTGAFVSVGSAGATLFSTDGITWTTATSATSNTLTAATFGAGRYVAVGAGGTIVTSTDGRTWQAVATNTTNDLRAVALGGFLTTTGTGVTATTTTNTVFVAVGAAGTLLTSSDGLIWTLRTPISANNMNGAAFGGRFIAVGSAGSIFTSTDGITWQAQVSGTNNELRAIARTVNGYTAVGASGTNLTSF